jgi:uncharacterized protein YbaR (Trm112 family)
MITICPLCKTRLKKKTREMEKGIYADVMVCPKCDESYLTLKQHEAIYKAFYSKTFMSGNSLAVRIPKKVAEKAKLKKGSAFQMKVRDGKIIIEAVA